MFSKITRLRATKSASISPYDWRCVGHGVAPQTWPVIFCCWRNKTVYASFQMPSAIATLFPSIWIQTSCGCCVIWQCWGCPRGMFNVFSETLSLQITNFHCVSTFCTLGIRLTEWSQTSELQRGQTCLADICATTRARKWKWTYWFDFCGWGMALHACGETRVAWIKFAP